MNNKFLKYYFEKQLYLENPPLKMNDFIKFCKKRGINIRKEKLEELEKKGLFYPIFRIKSIYNEITEVYMAPSFDSYVNEDFLKLYEEGNIYIPQDKEFVEFNQYYDRTIWACKVYSYYSSFQIYSLIFILDHEKLIEKPNPCIDKTIDILIATQIYAPYGRSNMERYSLKTNPEDYHQQLNEFDLNEALDVINANEDELYSIYAKICNELKKLLGSDDAIQIWRCIDWRKKDKCIGHTRLGIEYLQWAMMLKKCIESYLGREIYDVDEVQGDWEKVKYSIPSEERGATLRGSRNEDFTNKQTGEYEFNLKRKKLYYLANSLTLDYHPKIILFVEGKTERIMIPKFFKFYGYNISNLGIEIIDIGGISNFYSSKTLLKGIHDKEFKAIVNNFQNLINFNLIMWQTIPCFIGDNENGIVDKLINGKVFDVDELLNQIDNDDLSEDELKYLQTKSFNDTLVTGWSWTWDNDFEIDNFKPKEMQIAINEVCGTSIPLKKVENIYSSCKKGEKKVINKIHPKVKNKKIEINEKALDILIKNYEENPDDSILDRKIFKIIDTLIEISILNHNPTNTNHSFKNKKELHLSILQDYNIFKRYKDGI